MHARTKITDLTVRQYDALDQILKTDYEIPAGVTAVRVTFEMSTMNERHVSMPITELAQVMYVLELIERGAVAVSERTGWPASTIPVSKTPARVRGTGAATATGPGSIANSGVMTGYDPAFADRLENGAYNSMDRR